MAKETVVAQVGQPTSENEIAIRQEVSGVTIQVEGMVIASEDDFEEAAKIGLAIKAQAKKVAEFFAPMKKRASDAHKEICNREKMMLSPLQEAEKALKNKMGAYRLEEDRRRRLAEEEARRAAEEEQRRKEAEAIALESEGRNSEAYGEIFGGDLMKYKVKIDKAADREELALILVRNDYIVRITRQERATKRSYDYFVEFEEPRNES